LKIKQQKFPRIAGCGICADNASIEQKFFASFFQKTSAFFPSTLTAAEWHNPCINFGDQPKEKEPIDEVDRLFGHHPVHRHVRRSHFA
jgi:hypothetical protein